MTTSATTLLDDDEEVPVELYDCAVCGEETVVEQPPCAEGHTGDGGLCPEWVCTGCGDALLLGGAVLVQQAA